MKSIVLGLCLVFIHLVAHAEETFSGEFQLKATAHIEGLTLAPDYHIVVEGGTATVKFTQDGKPREEKGTVMLTVLSGIDPATKRPAKFNGFLRVELTNSGWAHDKFLTRIDLPIGPTGATREVPSSPDPEPVIGFTSPATVDVLWRDVLSNGIQRFSDPMGIRMHAEYSVEVIRSPVR